MYILEFWLIRFIEIKYNLTLIFVALDPALPLFVTSDKDKKIDKSDAKFVDVLHTNSLLKGKLERSGHVDFFANNGVDQPGCSTNENQS